MLTLLSTFLSFLMGGLPKLLDFFQDRADKSHELKLASMQTERELALAQAGFAAQQKVEEIKLDEIKTQTASDDRQALIGAQQAEVAIDARGQHRRAAHQRLDHHMRAALQATGMHQHMGGGNARARGGMAAASQPAVVGLRAGQRIFYLARHFDFHLIR